MKKRKISEEDAFEKTIDFSKGRRITPVETEMFRRAFFNTFGYWRPRRGRPAKGASKYQAIHIRLHPEALKWARSQAKKKGIGYQTVINDTLLRHASRAA